MPDSLIDRWSGATPPSHPDAAIGEAAAADTPLAVETASFGVQSGGVPERELKQAGLALSADWWPRHLGLNLDHGAQRWVFEPPEGASAWIQMESDNGGWTSRPFGQDPVPLDFAHQLLKQLRVHLSGAGSGPVSRLPVHSEDLVKSLGALEEKTSGRARPEPRKLPKPEPGEFTAAEWLGEARPRPASPLAASAVSAKSVDARLATVRAEVAQSLGATLMERFEWNRPVALERAPFDALRQAMAASSAEPPDWALRVDAKGRNVELILKEGGAHRCLGVVLKDGPHLDGLRIFRPDPKDDLEHLWNELAIGHNGRARTVGRVMARESTSLETKQPLADVDPEGRVMVLGHGEPGGAWRQPTVGGLTPRQLAAQLAGQGLSKAFNGTVYLNSCSSGNGLGSTEAFSHRLRQALADKGYRSLTVAARPGVTRAGFQRDIVAPSELVLHAPATLARTRRLIGSLEAQRERALREALTQERELSRERRPERRQSLFEKQEKTLKEMRIYADLVEQEKAYAARIEDVSAGARIAAQIARVKGEAIAALSPPAASGVKPPWHRRLMDGIKGLFRQAQPKPTVASEIDRQADWAYHDYTYDQVGVRHMWGHVGPRRAGSSRSKDARG